MSLITGPSVWSTSDSSLPYRVTVLEGKYVRSSRFVSIGSGTSGAITLPGNSTVVLDDFGGTVDALVTQMAGGRPTYASAVDSSGTIISTTFDSSGNYVFSGTPSSYPVALVYRVQQTLVNFDSTASDIVGPPQTAPTTSSFAPPISVQATYAAMTALGTPSVNTLYVVTADENKSYVNSTYLWLSNGSRLWIASTGDN